MKGQYRVMLTIKDDNKPQRDIGWHVAYPAHKTIKDAIAELKELQKVIDGHKLQKLEAKEHRLMFQGT